MPEGRGLLIASCRRAIECAKQGYKTERLVSERPIRCVGAWPASASDSNDRNAHSEGKSFTFSLLLLVLPVLPLELLLLLLPVNEDVTEEKH